MDIKYRLYPYPVLAYFNDDYIDSKFDVFASCNSNGYEIELNINVILDNSELNDVVRKGKAVFVYHLECAQSGFRRIVEDDNTSTKIVIKDTELNGDLHLCPFILAKEDLINYYNSKFNPDYSEPIARIEKGCVLAVGKEYNWNITKSNTDFLKSASPFRIVKNPDENVHEMIVDYEAGDRIYIKLCESDMAIYKSMKDEPGVHDILNSAIVVPALVYVLTRISLETPENLENEYGTQSWYLSIKQTLEKNFKIPMESLKDQDIYSLAQRMLRTPINNALEQLSTVGSKEGEEEA